MVVRSILVVPGLRRSTRRVGVVVAALSLFGIAAFAGGPPSHSPTLRVSPDAPHAALWRRLFDQMPSFWKSKRPLVVREVSDKAMDALVRQNGADDDQSQDDDSVIDGCYHDGGERESDPAVIILRDTLQGEQAALVFTHEYGHFVWDEKISDAKQAQYRRLWRRQRRAGQLVSEYAADSPEEGFAEAFSFYQQKPAVLRHRDPASWQFLHDQGPTSSSSSDPDSESSRQDPESSDQGPDE